MLQWFDTLMGLIVILLSISLVITILNQIMVALLNLRGNNLKKGIKLLLENSDVDLKPYAKMISEKVLSHELISDTWSTIGPWRFASTIRPNELINILKVIADSEKDDWQVELKKCLSKITTNIENWFGNIMDRATQSFVRQTRFWTIIFSLIVAFALHLDAFRLFEQISNDAELRASLIASSDAILKKTDEMVGTSSHIPAVYVEAIQQLKLQDTTGTASELGPPPAFASSEEGEKWLREQLAGNEHTEALTSQYKELIEANLINSIDILKERAISIKGELDKTKLQLIPQPYPGWDYSPGDIHIWGVLVMASFLSLGAPFWFKALKTMSALRPILAEKEEKERKNHKEK